MRNFAIRGVREGLENRGGSYVSVLVCSLMTGWSEEARGFPCLQFRLYYEFVFALEFSRRSFPSY